MIALLATGLTGVWLTWDPAPAAAAPVIAGSTTSTANPAATPPSPTGLAWLGPALGPGSQGQDVALAQWLLLGRGFWMQDRLGSYGESTRNAVVAFQKFNGLPRTGVVDFWTRIGIAQGGPRVSPVRAAQGRQVEVDLARQIMIVSTSGAVDAVFNISSGAKATPTVRGEFRVYRQIKGRHVAPLGVLFSPKFFTGGYAIHGSLSVPTYPASHGCVRTTNQTIDFIWAANLIPMGTVIRVF